jgi:predicted nucleic acid-binding Zn ribbon protein
MEKCPYCSGEIEVGTKKCRHCGEWLGKNKREISIVWKIILAVFLLVAILAVYDAYSSLQKTIR